MNVTIQDALTSPLALALVAYVMIVLLLSVLVFPLRQRLVVEVEQLLAEASWSQGQRDWLNHLLDTAMSFRVGLALIVSIVATIADDLIGRRRPLPRDRERLVHDRRLGRILWYYTLSILAANPIAAPVILMLTPFGLMVRRATHDRSTFKVAVEEPIIDASSAIKLGKHAHAC